jgi:two-component system sensor histidine kinase YesM
MGTKLNVLIMFSVFVPLIITLLMFNKYTTDTVYSNVRVTAENSFLQLYDIFSSRFEVIRQDTMMLQTSESARELLQQGVSFGDTLGQIRLKSQVGSMVSLIENKNIWGMRLKVYVPMQRSLFYDNQNFFPLSTAKDTLWYSDLTQNPYKNMWVYYPAGSPERKSQAEGGSAFSYLVRIVDPENFKQTASILQYDFLTDRVLSTMRQSLPLMKGACVFLADDQGLVILQAGGLEGGGLPEPVSSMSYSTTAWDTFVWKGTPYHVQRRSFKNNPWQLVMLVPFGNSIDSLLNNAQWSTFLALALICGVLIFFSSMLFSRGVINRLSSVSMGMSNLKDGVLQPLPEPKVRDEVGVLIESYNYLTEELNLLTAARSMANANQKHAEMKALQAQINPHFLYNTLEMINYFAFAGNASQVEKIVTLLSRFYKLCLNQGEEFSTLSQELDLTQVYWGIQEIRYEGRIRLELHVQQDLYQQRVPHIILQPIVENAIHHGIMNRPDLTGVIHIHGEVDHNDLILKIIDDGVGMTEEKIRQINEGMDLHFDSMEGGSHYGLRNIHERLLQFYGLGYGLSFDSVLGEGTTVTVRLPLQ